MRTSCLCVAVRGVCWPCEEAARTLHPQGRSLPTTLTSPQKRELPSLPLGLVQPGSHDPFMGQVAVIGQAWRGRAEDHG